MKTRGLVLIVVVGILGVLAILAVAFVAMAQLERRASEQRVNAARAYLLARSGIEDALARLALGQDPAYGGEDWNGDAVLDGPEAGNEIFQRGKLNVEDCPARHAMRPSFFAADSLGKPRLAAVEGRDRGYSGSLSGDYAPLGNAYALKASSSNAGIHVNGGALDAQDRDPDGPGADASAFPLNPGAAVEVAPLLPNEIPDYKDTSMEGPNGFLVRLLNNLDAIITNSATSNLGVQIVESRPLGGYKSLDELKPVLSQARYDRFKPYLTLHAWVDPKVVKPQPMDGRPQRWEDIDDAHRIGAEAEEISGYRLSGGGGVQLNPRQDPRRAGTEADPWTQGITATNTREGTVTYPVSWERNFVHAWSQLRLAPPAMEPRAPLSVNRSPKGVLASVFLGLKGVYPEVWDGSGGWDCCIGSGELGYGSTERYPYPSQATEQTPWHRTRMEYGMTYGASTGSPPARPWYGPRNYDPHAVMPWAKLEAGGQSLITWTPDGGKPVIQAAALARLKETAPITLDQAKAVAREIQDARPFRTWERFNACVDKLPLWEDVNDDGVLDGEPYTVTVRDNSTGGSKTYTRRMYRREDIDSDGLMSRQVFDKAPGLTIHQKDVLKAMVNPNTDLNDFNPDANLWKEVDKTDVAGIGAEGAGYVHTTELSCDGSGGAAIRAAGRVTTGRGRLLAQRRMGVLMSLSGGITRDTTQADFMRAYNPGDPAPQPLGSIFSPSTTLVSPAPYPLAGGQALVSYPEPQTISNGPRWANAGYDGQISLGFIGPSPLALGTVHDSLLGDLFDTADATGTVPANVAAADLRGPFHLPLVTVAGLGTGNVFPDGVYSEKDRSPKYGAVEGVTPVVSGGFGGMSGWSLYADAGDYLMLIPSFSSMNVACWMKLAWFPEASPRPHALISLSPGQGDNSGTIYPGSGIQVQPIGLYFLPARNNAMQDAMLGYPNASGCHGLGWPRRSLLFGGVDDLYASDCLNRRGMEFQPMTKPVGRLEAHRWQHVAGVGDGYSGGTANAHGSFLMVGRWPACLERTGGGYHTRRLSVAPPLTHSDGTLNHLRFGEIAGGQNMNYAADATFANVRAGYGVGADAGVTATYGFMSATSPAALGRYYKEPAAAYISPKLPQGIRPLRITWTEIPCDLWFDEDGDRWLGDAAAGYKPMNDRFGAGGQPGPNGLRDVHVALEIWADMGTPDPSDDVRLARFDDPAGENRIPAGAVATGTLSPVGDALPLLPGLAPGMFTRASGGRLYYKAVFVNEWDAATRANHPLDVTPFLDDVTLTYMDAAGPRIRTWETGGED